MLHMGGTIQAGDHFRRTIRENFSATIFFNEFRTAQAYRASRSGSREGSQHACRFLTRYESPRRVAGGTVWN